MRDSSLHFVSLGMTTKATADPSVAGGDLGMTSLSKGDGGISRGTIRDAERTPRSAESTGAQKARYAQQRKGCRAEAPSRLRASPSTRSGQAGARLKTKTRIRTHPSRTTRRMGHPQKQEKADPPVPRVLRTPPESTKRTSRAVGRTALCNSAPKRDSSSAPGGLRMTIAGVRLMRGARRRGFRGRWLWRVSRHREKQKLL